MDGYTIRSLSGEGEYYFVKNWQRYHTFWLTYKRFLDASDSYITDYGRDMLYKSAKVMLNQFNRVLESCSDYANDDLEVIGYENGRITFIAPIVIEKAKSVWESPKARIGSYND